MTWNPAVREKPSPAVNENAPSYGKDGLFPYNAQHTVQQGIVPTVRGAFQNFMLNCCTVRCNVQGSKCPCMLNACVAIVE